ncbi:MAG TPA: calcium-binding protein, partial [Allosphingosinicella sp.]
ERLGTPVVLSSAAVDPSGTIDLVALGDGRMAAVWTDAAGDLSGQILQSLVGTFEGESLSGGPGDDTIFGSPGNDILRGNDGDDALHAYEGSDDLFGGDGDDALFGGDGDDILRGGPGVDSFDGGDHTTLFDWYRGYGDRVSFFEEEATQGVVADLRTGIISNDGFGNVETMANIESLGADTAYVDTLYGNDSSNFLFAGLGDHLHGFGGNDILLVYAAAATVDGGDGLDTLRLVSYFAGYRPDGDGDGLAETGSFPTSGYTVDLLAGTFRDGDGNTGIVTGIENLAGSSFADALRGNGGNNTLRGEGGNDIFQLQDGGVDLVRGDSGNDIFLFLGTLTAEDRVDGQDQDGGVDTLVLQGDYGGGLTLTANVNLIDRIAFLAGSNTHFGEPGTNRHDYVLTTHDSNFGSGVRARINGSALLAGEDLTFDGSAETDAGFDIYGGRGVDTLTGGLRNDVFFFDEERLAPGDTVDGGGGYDALFLRGNYSVDFDDPGYGGLFTSIENLTLTSVTDSRYGRGGTGFDYDLTLSDSLVDPGQVLTVSGAVLMAGETMVLDASRETDGLLRLFGGKASDTLKGGGQNDLIHGNLGADSLTGNGGADAFRYQNVDESSSASMDRILDFTPGTDKVELDRIDANALVAGNQAFSWIGSSAFTGSAGQLRAYE